MRRTRRWLNLLLFALFVTGSSFFLGVRATTPPKEASVPPLERWTSLPLTTPTPLPTSIPTVAVVVLDPRGRTPTQAILSAQAAQAKATSFRVVSEVTRHGSASQSIIEYVAPSTFRLVGEERTSIIVIGAQAWSTDAQGTWQVAAASVVHEMQSLKPSDPRSNPPPIADAIYLGITPDGLLAYQYTLASPTAEGNLVQRIEVHVDTTTDFPMFLRSTSPGSNVTLAISGYNTPMDIQPPIR